MGKIEAIRNISWREAYRLGFSVAINHKVFILIAAFSVICERSVILFFHFTGISFKEVLQDYQGLFISFSENPTGGLEILAPFGSLFSFMPVAIGLFVLGAFILVGILGLMRDLLVREGYRSRDIIVRGKQYFWSVVKFKLPIYLIMSTLLILVASLALQHRHDKSEFVIWAIGGALVYGFAFIFARVILSLGPKMIVTQEIKKISPVYQEIIQIIRPALGQVIIFYLLMFVLIGFGFLLPFGIGQLEGYFFLRTIISVFLVSFFTVFVKSSSFCMYLQLAAFGNKAHSNTELNS